MPFVHILCKSYHMLFTYVNKILTHYLYVLFVPNLFLKKQKQMPSI